MTLMFPIARQINHETGETIRSFSEGDEFVVGKERLVPWSKLDDTRFPGAGSTLGNFESLVRDSRDGGIYAIPNDALLEAGIDIPVFA